MNLQKILSYQEIDKKVYACEMELKQSKTAQEYAKAMTMYKAKTEDMMKKIREAEEIAVLVERYKQTYKNIFEEINGLSDVLESFEELKEIDKYEKKIAQFQKELLNIERELTRLSKKMDECIEISKKSLEQLKQLEEIIMRSKFIMQKMKAEVEEKAKTHLLELKKLQAELPPNLIAKYNEIRKNKKMPVLVPASENYKACLGCGMDISSDLSIKLQGGQIVECPNCGRLIYNEK